MVRNCDFFVLPSLYETFGIVYAEATASGKPVIATNNGGQTEIVNEKVGLLVPLGDNKSLIKAIEYMLDNYCQYDPNDLFAYAKSKFLYEVVGRKLTKIYNEVIKRAKGDKSKWA